MNIDIDILKLKDNRLLKDNKQIMDYMLALDKIENGVKFVEYIPILVDAIDNNTCDKEITASAVSILEDVIAENDVSTDAVMAFLNASLEDYDSKYEFLDEVFFALFNFAENSDVLTECYKKLTNKNQSKLVEILKELSKEDEHKFSKILEKVMEEEK